MALDFQMLAASAYKLACMYEHDGENGRVAKLYLHNTNLDGTVFLSAPVRTRMIQQSFLTMTLSSPSRLPIFSKG